MNFGPIGQIIKHYKNITRRSVFFAPLQYEACRHIRAQAESSDPGLSWRTKALNYNTAGRILRLRDPEMKQAVFAMLKGVVKAGEDKLVERDLMLLISCFTTFLSKVDENTDSFPCEAELTYLLDKLTDEMTKFNDDHLRTILERLCTSLNKNTPNIKITDKTHDYLSGLLNDLTFI